ncbi:histidine kinase dimerization/phosphoacceptor domain-containing protein [Streptomyces thinghirensis]|nr:histidine kinase dimerization/phosphoacceptor domain-containing protein [Streptomyces thinghirensis]
MHDIIGHNLSVITGLADGGRYAAARSPERAAQALDAIATTSRQALGELRRLLDVLREEDQHGTQAAELALQPSLTDLDQLLDGVRRAGLPVRTTVQGRGYSPGGPPAHGLPRHPGSPHQHPQARRPRRHRTHRPLLRDRRRRRPHRHRHRPRRPGHRPLRRPRPARHARANVPVRRHT